MSAETETTIETNYYPEGNPHHPYWLARLYEAPVTISKRLISYGKCFEAFEEAVIDRDENSKNMQIREKYEQVYEEQTEQGNYMLSWKAIQKYRPRKDENEEMITDETGEVIIENEDGLRILDIHSFLCTARSFFPRVYDKPEEILKCMKLVAKIVGPTQAKLESIMFDAPPSENATHYLKHKTKGLYDLVPLLDNQTVKYKQVYSDEDDDEDHDRMDDDENVDNSNGFPHSDEEDSEDEDDDDDRKPSPDQQYAAPRTVEATYVPYSGASDRSLPSPYKQMSAEEREAFRNLMGGAISSLNASIQSNDNQSRSFHSQLNNHDKNFQHNHQEHGRRIDTVTGIIGQAFGLNVQAGGSIAAGIAASAAHRDQHNDGFLIAQSLEESPMNQQRLVMPAGSIASSVNSPPKKAAVGRPPMAPGSIASSVNSTPKKKAAAVGRPPVAPGSIASSAGSTPKNIRGTKTSSTKKKRAAESQPTLLPHDHSRTTIPTPRRGRSTTPRENATNSAKKAKVSTAEKAKASTVEVKAAPTPKPMPREDTNASREKAKPSPMEAKASTENKATPSKGTPQSAKSTPGSTVSVRRSTRVRKPTKK